MENSKGSNSPVFRDLYKLLGKKIISIYWDLEKGEIKGIASKLQSITDYNIIMGDDENEIISIDYWSDKMAMEVVFDYDTKKPVFVNQKVIELGDNIMKQKEKESSLFQKLQDLIGKKAICVYRDLQTGERKGLAAKLKEVGKYDINLGDTSFENIPIDLFSAAMGIEAVFDGKTQENVYVNEHVRNQGNALLNQKQLEQNAHVVKQEDDTPVPIAMENLTQILGQEITCKYWHHGVCEEARGTLDNVIPYDCLYLTNELIEFAGYRRTIEEIRNAEGNIVYKNSKAKGYEGIKEGDVFILTEWQKKVLGRSLALEHMEKQSR